MPTLLGYLSSQIIAPITRKNWFSGEYIRLDEYVWRAQSFYEMGAVLGVTYRERLAALVELFSDPGRQTETLSALAESAEAQVSRIEKEPEDFLDLFFKPEVERLMNVLREAGRTHRSAWSDFSKVARKRLRREDMLTPLEGAGHKGIALGSRFPELTEKLLAHTPDAETWTRFRTRSSYLPTSPPPPRSLPERQAEAISMIKPYVETVRPDLLARLGLWPEGAADFQQRFRAILARRMDHDG